MTDRGGGWQRDTPTIFTSTMSICSVDTRHLPATVQLQLYYMNMRIKATIETRNVLLVHTHGGTNNIQVSIWYQMTEELKIIYSIGNHWN